MKTVQFKKWRCDVIFDKYCNNNRTAIILIDRYDNQPVATATVNIPEMPLADDMVYIKDWEENSGILDALSNADIIEYTGIDFPIGQCVAKLCKIKKG